MAKDSIQENLLEVNLKDWDTEGLKIKGYNLGYSSKWIVSYFYFYTLLKVSFG